MLTLQSWSKPELLGVSAALDKVDKSPKTRVVSIGVDPAFKIIFTPLEYIPTGPPLLSYVIKICLGIYKTIDVTEGSVLD